MSMMTKKGKYEEVLPQIEALIAGETNEVGVMANIAAALKEAFGFFWVGFYVVSRGAENEELWLGPFQGPVACYRIPYGKGVCGTAWQRGETVVVPDVEDFPGHIACSSLSRSEIVVPVFDGKGECRCVLDIDSRELNMFDDIDREYLELAMAAMARTIYGGC